MCWILGKTCHPKKKTRTQAKDLKQSPTLQHNQIKHNLSKHSHNKTDLHTENVMDAVVTYIKIEQHECPAWGQSCRKCGNLNHYEYVCHSQSSRSGQRNRRNNCSMVSEIRNSTPSLSLMSNNQNTVPKQVLDIVDMANSVDNLSQCYKRQLQLDTLTTSNLTSSTQIFSNIKVNGYLGERKAGHWSWSKCNAT